MISVVVAMCVILAVAAGTVAVVLVGMEGRGGHRAPHVARLMRRTARHLNGEGRPPRRLQLFNRH